MLRYAKAAERHLAQLGKIYVTTFQDFHTAFLGARTAQLLAIGEVKSKNLTAVPAAMT